MSLHEAAPLVRIHYLRPPDHLEVFEQRLVAEPDGVKITLARSLTFDPPLRIGGRVVLETGSDVVWFTFPGAWHDIGRFHTEDGTFRGYYANILTPPTFHPGHVWRTTDLFLDVWMWPDGDLAVLDEDQFEEACSRDWLDPGTAARARRELASIRELHGRKRWPPEVVRDWTRERVLEGWGE